MKRIRIGERIIGQEGLIGKEINQEMTDQEEIIGQEIIGQKEIIKEAMAENTDGIIKSLDDCCD